MQQSRNQLQSFGHRSIRLSHGKTITLFVLGYTRLRHVADRIDNEPNCAFRSESMPLRAAQIDRLHRQVSENRTRVCLVEIPPWYLVLFELARCGDASMTGDDAIFAIDQIRVH